MSVDEKDETASEGNLHLDSGEWVLRHQLNLAAYWAAKHGLSREDEGSAEIDANGDQAETTASNADSSWNLTGSLSLHSWQRECREAWFQAGGRGVVKVVTGAGKTIAALSIIEELQNTKSPDLRVAIVVPTIVLMDQWYSVLQGLGNLPESAIGRMGGGSKDGFDDDVRILVCVLASAAKDLGKAAECIDPEALLLVADECHRTGAEKMAAIFEVGARFTLGLSATPEREKDDSLEDEDSDVSDIDTDEAFEDTVLGRELGSIVYELDFVRAIEAGILPTFEIRHYGLPLNPEEQAEYGRVSREIGDMRKRLMEGRSSSLLRSGAIVGWARRMASRGSSPQSGLAADFVQQVSARKRLLYHAKARMAAVETLIRLELDRNPEARILLFHESIGEVMRLFDHLRREGLPVVAEHSQLAESLRRESISLFRSGAARIMVSARSLIEGFDVPAADVGIVVASSSSVRQRVQTLGRILRKGETDEDGDKHAVLHVFYTRDTTDELIYEKNDWEEFTGAERNRYFFWEPTSEEEPEPRPGPPRRPLPHDTEIDLTALKPGDEWPGRFEGAEYSFDSQGNVTDANGAIVRSEADLPAMIGAAGKEAGRFRITPGKRAVLIRVTEQDRWTTRFCGSLEAMPKPVEDDPARNEVGKEIDVDSMKPGDPWPVTAPKGQEFILRQKAGRRRIAKKVKNGEVFARTTENAEDRNAGEEAESLIEDALSAQRATGSEFFRITLTEDGDALFTADGVTRFIRRLQSPLEFP